MSDKKLMASRKVAWTSSDKNKQELHEKRVNTLLNKNKATTDRRKVKRDNIEQRWKTFRDTVAVAGIQERGEESRKS